MTQWVKSLYNNKEESLIWSDKTPDLNHHWVHFKFESISVDSLCSQSGKSKSEGKKSVQNVQIVEWNIKHSVVLLQEVGWTAMA